MKTALMLAAGGLATVTAVDIKPLIVGGTVVPIGQKTYTVGLRYNETGENFCDGTLISPTHVLGAAHCAENKFSFVSIGSHFLDGSVDGERIAIKKETPHPLFNYDTAEYDYSIIELARPSKFKPIPLLDVDSEKFAGAKATTMGWGVISETGPPAQELLRVNLPVLSDAQCKAANLTSYPITKTMFCAGGKVKDTCYGDSGGPLILERSSGDVLIGVVSWGDGCGVLGKPGVYAKVNVVKDWINSLAPKAKWVK